MAIIKSYSPLQNLSNYGTFINDTNPNSDYFRITEFNETFTGGKNGFLIEGSEYLKETTEIKIEILDVEGNPVYYEPGNGVPEYYEGIAKLVSIHVYEDTPIGIGKITILGELKTYEDASGVIRDIPAEWRGAYNVKWERTFQINKNLTNETRVRFYKRPVISIDEIVKPIFNVTTPFVIQSGSVEGISEIPIAGTNLSRWTAGTLYKLKRVDGSGWTSSIDENIIELPEINYTANIVEVLNTDEVLVDKPYTINNVVANFTQSSYTSSFEYLDGQTFTESALTGSFAKIQISNLKTFVGDVARVKVFRKSRNDVGDYVLVQESKLESTELLRDLTATGQTDISYGNFTQTNLDTYWTGSSNLLPTINLDKLYASVKPSNGQIGVQTLYTSQSVSVAKDVEYTLTFKTLYSGSVDNSKSLRAYLSSSNYTQEFLTLSGSAIYQTKQDITQNIIAIPTSSLADAKLVFEFNGSGWYISNISLKNAQETSFSPDEFTIVQDVSKNVATETFDFRFEFYDINNNYIPVDVFATKTFTGGNNFLSSGKLLSFQSDRTAFRFASGSIQNPQNQQIKFTISQNNLTGQVTFASSAFDTQGNYLNPSDYTKYPGELTSVTPAGAILTIDNFTGSRVDGNESPYVGSIIYTASIDSLSEYETVYRLEDGENAPGLFVTADANQFVYKATNLTPNPLNQKITFLAKRKNLSSGDTPILISSGSAPGLTILGTNLGTGITSYSLDILDFPYSIPSPSASYYFTASDEFGNYQYDTVTISQVKILDGLSVNLSNENTTLPAKSTGFVESGSFVLTSGSVSVKVGGEDISRQEGLTTNNRWDIISATETNCIANDTTPDDATYGITSLTKDSGSLSLLVRYKDGAGDTTDIRKVVTYTKAKTAVPNVTITATPQAQSVLANAAGVQTGTLTDVVVSALEGNISRFTSMTATYTGFSTNPTINGATLTMSSAVMNAAEASATIVVTHTDSEGTTGQTKTIVVRATKVVTGANGTNGTSAVTISVTPPSQIVTRTNTGTYGTPGAITIGVTQGSTAFTAVGSSATLADNQFKLTSIVGSASSTNSTITPTTPTTTAGTTVTFNLVYKQVGVSEVTLAQTHSVSVVLDGQTGPGVVFTGLWTSGRAYQFSTGAGTGRRDVVLWSANGNAPYNTYYGAIRQHTSATGDVINGSPNQPAQTAWESLGTQDLFVAAKIGLFQESYVQNTLNIGTNNNGGVSTANITLAGGTSLPYFSLGQTVQGVYNADGIFIGAVNDGGTKYRMSLKGGSNALTWDGSTLTITGAISGGTISIGSGNSIFKADSNGIYLGNATFASAPFRVTPGGVLTSTSGTIGGWTLGSTTLTGGAAILDSAGAISIGSGNSIFKADGNGIYLGNATFGSAPFRVTQGGVLTASSVNISGTITATSGTFTGEVYASAGTFIGSVTATSGTFTGTVNAGLGNIGGWIIGTNTLSSVSDSVVLDSVGKKITIKNAVGSPSVIFSQSPTFGSFGGNYTNSGTNAQASGPSSPQPAVNFERLIASNAILGASTPTGTNVLFTVQEKTPNGTTAITLSTAVDGVTSEYAWFLRNTTTGATIEVLKDSANKYGFPATTAFIGGFNALGSVTIAGSGQNWDLYQRLKWTYSGQTFTSNNGWIWPEGRWSAEQVSSFTEIIDGGIQTGNSPVRYVRMQRSAATTMLEVGGAITATDNITAYASDKRLKENIIPIDNALERVEKLNGVHYTWKDEVKELGFYPSKLDDTGLLAQEVQAVLPNAVKLAPFDANDGVSISGENYLTVQYEKVVPLLVEAIKELSAEIKELKKGR